MDIRQSLWLAGGWKVPPQASDDVALALVFGAPTPLDDDQVLGAVRAAYPRAVVVGCSTAGEIWGASVFEGAVVVTAVAFCHATARAVAAGTEGMTSFALGHSLGTELARGPLVHVLVFCDGIDVNGSELARGLRASLPSHVATTGGLAADGGRFSRTLVVHDGRPWEHRVVAVGLSGPGLRVGMGSFGGWDPFGPERRVTRSEGNVLFELDGHSALGLYEQYLGDRAEDLPSSGLRFPLSVRIADGASVVRTLQSVDRGRKTMTFAGDVPEGSHARLMKANLDRLIDGAQKAGMATLESLPGEQAQLAMLVSCVGRKLVLAQRVEEELESVRDVLGAVPFAGFYSYGELCPSRRGDCCDLHNQTMTITTFGEVPVPLRTPTSRGLAPRPCLDGRRPGLNERFPCMHPLLARQLRRHFPRGAPAELTEFLQAVDAAYAEADVDRGLLERSLDLTSRELLERGAALEAEILERKLATADLERRAAAIAASTDGISVLDGNGVFVWVNAAHLRLYGYAPEELVGQPWTLLHRTEEAEGLERAVTTALARTGRWAGQIIGRMANGDPWEQEVSLTQHVDSVIRIARDVSERTKLERSLREAQKMDAIGRLAGGIAHDFNNVLAVIVACAELVLADLPDDSPVRPDILEIRRASERAATVTTRLLTFARRQVVEPRLMVLDDVVLQLGKLLRRTIGEQVSLVVRPGAPGGQVLADAGQVEQVLLNLVLNARDAMPRGGTITLSTEATVGAACPPATVPDGHYILLRVSDTGVGITEAVKAHLFEPFFTTKPAGSGTGLGLATCYGILLQLGGRIWVESELGHGTTFFVALPRAEGSSRGCASTTPSAPRGGTERVLLVEDDPHVRQVAARLLLLWGYDVTVCSSAEDALQLVLDSALFDLVVTDVVMPRLNGPDMVDRLRAEGLRAPVLFVTGYMDRLQTHPDVRVLAKPFTASQLAVAVRDALEMPGLEHQAG